MRARNSCAYPLMVLTGVHAVGSFTVKPDMTSRQSDSHVARKFHLHTASFVIRLHEGAQIDMSLGRKCVNL